MKTFRAADGRQVAWRNEQQIEDATTVTELAFLIPILAIILFALAGGMVP